MKKIFLFISVLLISTHFIFSEIKAGLLNGPSAVPAAYLIENKDLFFKDNFKTDFQVFPGADLEIPKLLKGELDIAVLPPNVAVKLWNMSKGNIVLLAVTGEGNISLISKDPDYKSISNLKGKTIYCAGRGATPEYMFKFILENNKLQDSVTLDFSIPNPELAAALISDKASYILVPEPFATAALISDKTNTAAKVMNLSEEYNKIIPETKNFPMTVLVANKNNIKNKKKEITHFLSQYEKAVIWTNKNLSEAGALVQKNTLGLNEKIASAAIPYSAYTFIPASKAKKNINDLISIFYDQNPDSVGGKLPDETFFYK